MFHPGPEAIAFIQQAQIGGSEWLAQTFQAFCLVGIAELFDKTWFVALLMALRYDKLTVFNGCYLALFAHVIIAAIFGYTVSKVVPIIFLHFGAAALYAFFAVLYFKDWHEADPDSDIIEAGKEEAGADITEDIEETSTYGATEKKGQLTMRSYFQMKVFGQCFITMFIAEWGDRTQIAMIGQHASQPLIPVCLGSAIAFFLLTLSAVIVGMMLKGQKLSEKTVHFVSALSFAIFAALALHDGLTQQRVDMR